MNRGRDVSIKRRRQVARPSANKRQKVGGSINPPQFASNLRFKHKYRFSASGAFAAAITDTSILDATGGICTVVNAQLSLFVESFKIRKIEVWAAPASQGANSTVSLDWIGFGNSPNIEFSDTTLSVTKNAHIVTRPPELSLCHFWQRATGTALFTLTCPANSVIDITLDLVLADQEVALTAPGIAAGVLGHIYYLSLDHATSNILVPVSLNTTN